MYQNPSLYNTQNPESIPTIIIIFDLIGYLYLLIASISSTIFGVFGLVYLVNASERKHEGTFRHFLYEMGIDGVACYGMLVFFSILGAYKIFIIRRLYPFHDSISEWRRKFLEYMFWVFFVIDIINILTGLYFATNRTALMSITMSIIFFVDTMWISICFVVAGGGTHNINEAIDDIEEVRDYQGI